MTIAEATRSGGPAAPASEASRPGDWAFYLLLAVVGAFLWWASRYRAAAMPQWAPWEFSWSWFLATTLALWWYFRGMPRVVRRLTDLRILRWIVGVIQQPVIASFLFVGLVAFRLIPAVHFRAMIDCKLYQTMNWSMVVDGILFWVLVLDPRPKPPARVSFAGRATMAVAVVPPQMLIGALIVFASYDIYGFYAWCGRIYPAIGALGDQQIGGLNVWIPPAMMSGAALLLVINAFRRQEEKEEKG